MMTPKQEAALRQALEALTHLQPTALTSFYTIGDRDKAITAIREALAEQPAQQQEPVAWFRYESVYEYKNQLARCTPKCIGAFPVYTSPPRKPWVGLTDEEIDKTHETQVWDARRSYARAIEAKLKEKNA